MAAKILRGLALTVLGLAATLGLVVIGALGYRAMRLDQVVRATAVDHVRGVDEAMFVRIGGVEQYVVIRGQDRRNPVLLLVHGGPGLPTSPYPRTFLFGWTRDFTVVQWDQRGTGHSFGRSGPVGPNVGIDRMAQDGIEVAEFVRRRLGKAKIVLVGHSWGTALGVRMALARPDLFYAYVGTGQMVSKRAAGPIGYAHLLAKARARGDHKVVDDLLALGPPPYGSTEQEARFSGHVADYEPGGLKGPALLGQIVFESGASLADLKNYVRGVSGSADHFRSTVRDDDLRSLGRRFAIPVFVFQGAQDDITPPDLARGYVAAISAPQARYVEIPDAGHNAMTARSEAFLTLLDRWVRPLAVAAPEPPSAQPLAPVRG